MSHRKAGKVAYGLSLKEKRANELMLEGLTFRAIAVEMGCSPAAAFNYVFRGIRKLPQEPAAQVREKHAAICEAVIADGVSRTAEAEDIKGWLMGVKGITMQMDRLARFLGLDAPKETRNINIDNMSDGDLKKKAIELLGGNPDDQNKEDNPST